jgi:hypothetical protein
MKVITTAILASLAIVSGVPSSAQVTSVDQLRDVQPTEWSYQAISNLVSRYGCVAGFPDGTFKPGQPATRGQLAALTSACLDRIAEYQTEADAKLAAALRSEFSKEISSVSSRVIELEVIPAAKNNSVGNYVGIGVLLNKQGVSGSGVKGESKAGDTVSGATLQGRYALGSVLGGEYSLRPYINAAAGPSGEIGAAGGALVTYDYSLSKAVMPDGSEVSRANVYAGVGYQVPFTNNVEASRQASIGNDRYGQAVFVIGTEGRVTNSITGFADVKLPTINSGVNGTAYSPVFTTGLGIRF